MEPHIHNGERKRSALPCPHPCRHSRSTCTHLIFWQEWKKKAPLLSACHVCSLKETSLVLISAPAKSWGNCHFLLEFSFFFFSFCCFIYFKTELMELMLTGKKKQNKKKTKKTSIYLSICEMWSVGASMLEIEQTGETEGQRPLSVARHVLSLVTQDVQCIMRNIVIWVIAVFIQTPLPTPIPVSVCLTHWLFLAQNRVLSSRGPGVPLLLNPPRNHPPPPLLLPTCNPAVALCSSWKFPPNYSDKTPTSAAGRHPLHHTLTHTHTHAHTHANTLICIKKVSSVLSYRGTRADVAAGRKESLMHWNFIKWKWLFYLFTTKYT